MTTSPTRPEHSFWSNGAWGRWFAIIRQIVTFILGVTVIMYSIFKPGHDWFDLLGGFFLIGLIPVDQLITYFIQRGKPIVVTVERDSERPTGTTPEQPPS
jgi:hypothetical protein